MTDLQDSLTPPGPNTRPTPAREDCWTEEASSTLIDSWGRRFLELNRGNLRQKDWQEVADAVNALHGHTKKTHRTDVQCKNRVDTIKKKYKTEKARVLSSNGSFTSNWPFYDRLDALIGSNFNAKKPSPSPSMLPLAPVALPLPFRTKTPSPVTAAPAPAVALPQKRSSGTVLDRGYFRRNYSAVAAAAAAAEVDEDEDEDEEEEVEEEEERGSEVEEEDREGEGMGRLAKAIERFGEVYERVEGEKLRQMLELEKQRMQFAKDLEVQRMQMFMDTQVRLERIKREKRSGSSDGAKKNITNSAMTIEGVEI